jgi:hypothetical protein
MITKGVIIKGFTVSVFFIKEISEMNKKMSVIFIHEESNCDAFIQEANIVMKKNRANESSC